MGMSMLGNSRCGCPPSAPTSTRGERVVDRQVLVREPNPNPRNFRVDMVEEIGGFAIAEIYYPDCTNYEGRKVLVFEGVTELDIMRMDFIDPHFCDRGRHLTPVARFEPTPKGWDLARAMCRI